MNKIIIALCAVVMAGCATGTHIVTGTQHPALKPEQVTLYQIPPAKYEIIGIVNSQSPGKGQHNMDDAVDVLKQEAGEIGANGIILGAVSPGSESVGVGMGSGFGGGMAFSGSTVAVSSRGIQLQGTAIFVESAP
jgi:ribulose 1,5-bisphosphate synthetase/thiazole synthase